MFNGTDVQNFKARQFRKLLQQGKNTSPCANGFWKRKCNFDVSKSTWLKPMLSTKETRLRELQWKLLHNIYPTNILLAKIKVKPNNKCSLCPDEVDYVEHFFYECPSIKIFWKQVEGEILRLTAHKVKLTAQDVLFGLQGKQVKAQDIHIIDHIILIGKMCISICKKKTPLRLIF